MKKLSYALCLSAVLAAPAAWAARIDYRAVTVPDTPIEESTDAARVAEVERHAEELRNRQNQSPSAQRKALRNNAPAQTENGTTGTSGDAAGSTSGSDAGNNAGSDSSGTAR
jgi:hypothetical protein